MDTQDDFKEASKMSLNKMERIVVKNKGFFFGQSLLFLLVRISGLCVFPCRLFEWRA